MPKFEYFGQKSIKFLIFSQNYVPTLFGRCWFEIWHCFLKSSSPNPQICAFWVKNNQLSNLSKILLVAYFECANFKSDIGFEKFWAQIPKYGLFEPKSINFLILTKFCLYPISKVQISRLTFAFCGFQQPSTKVTRTNSTSPFGKRFFVFSQKCQNIMASIVTFWGCLLQYDKKI